MDKKLLGQILASVVIAAIEAGEILLDPTGKAAQPDQIGAVAAGVIDIWTQHPATRAGQTAIAAGA